MNVITRLNKVISVDFAKRPGTMKYILYSYFHLSIRTHFTNKRCLQCYLNGSLNSPLHFTSESGVSQRDMPLSPGALTDCLLSCCSVDTIVWVSHVILFTGNLSWHEICFITSVASPLSDLCIQFPPFLARVSVLNTIICRPIAYLSLEHTLKIGV